MAFKAHRFSEKDEQNLVKFLNFIALSAKFTLTTKDVIEYFHLLDWAQKQLLEKVKAHVLEIKEIVEPSEPEPEGDNAV